MELNAEQIKKALECCVIGDCYPCPYGHIGVGCRDDLCRDALALINSQEQRIKELTEENERLIGERAKFFEYKHGTMVRNALVLTKNKKEFDDFCKAIKSDTVRKMQERMKKDFLQYKHDATLTYIDQIAKEMLEGV